MGQAVFDGKPEVKRQFRIPWRRTDDNIKRCFKEII
jgi:hypothetical protein